MKVYIACAKQANNHKELEELAVKIGNSLTSKGVTVSLSHTFSDGKTTALPSDKLKSKREEIKKSGSFVLILDEPNIESGVELGFAFASKVKNKILVYKRKDRVENFVLQLPFKKVIEWHSDDHVIHNIERIVCQGVKKK
jgi:hypothetical protein